MIAISCNGLANDISDCFRRLSEECPTGYQMAGNYGESNPFFMGTGANISGGAVVKRTVIAVCRPASENH